MARFSLRLAICSTSTRSSRTRFKALALLLATRVTQLLLLGLRGRLFLSVPRSSLISFS